MHPNHQFILQLGNIALKRCKHGFMFYNRNDFIIGKSLEYYGEWCEQELDSLARFIRNGDVILDIGAYIGSHTLFFAERVAPSGMVIACEPQRLAYQNLCANILINNLKNVDCKRVAIGDVTGIVKVPSVDPDIPANYGRMQVGAHKFGDDVNIIRIDDLHLDNCNLIKIDVEGYETKALIGAKETIEKFRPILFVENNAKDKSRELIATLQSYGYTCWWHFCDVYNPNNYFRDTFDHFMNASPLGRTQFNLFCLPQESDIEIKAADKLYPVEGSDDDWEKALSRSKQK